MFGKVMSIPDELMVKYFRLCTPLEVSEVDAIEAGLTAGALHPNATKRRLAREIVTLYHDADAAVAAEEAFDRVFKQHEMPEDIPEVGRGLRRRGLPARDDGGARSGRHRRRTVAG